MNKKMRARKRRQARRVALTLVLMLTVALVSIGGTVAWLTAKTEAVTNVFTVGNIGLALVETEEDFKMVPGDTIDKDPKVTVAAGSEASWVFVKIEEANDLDTFITYTVDFAWTALDATQYPGVYYIQQAATIGNGAEDENGVKADAAVTYSVLTNDKVTVNSSVTKSQMDALTSTTQPTLTFTAYAIQQEGFTTATVAWQQVLATTTWDSTTGANTPA